MPTNCTSPNAICLENEALFVSTPFALFYPVDPVEPDFKYFRLSMMAGPFTPSCNYSNTLQNYTFGTPKRLNAQTNYSTISIRDTANIKNLVNSKQSFYFQLMDASIGSCVYSQLMTELPPKPGNAVLEDTSDNTPAQPKQGWDLPVKAFVIMGCIAAFVVGITLLVALMLANKKESCYKLSENFSRPIEAKADECKKRLTEINYAKVDVPIVSKPLELTAKELKNPEPIVRLENNNLVINMENATYLNSSPDSFQWTAKCPDDKEL